MSVLSENGSVIIKIKGDDADLKSKLSSVGDVASKAMKTTVAAIGAAGAAMAGLGAYAIKAGAEFETSMAKASTLFGEVAVDVDNLQSQILEVSNRTGVAAAELGNSLYNALSAGIPVTEDMAVATDALEKSARLAKAGFTDIDTALSATAKTMNAYGMGVEDIDDIQKIMIQTQNLGITTVGELGASLAQVTPTAASFGVAFDQVGASLANMTAMGTPTAQATTQLNALIAELGKNGTTAAKGLDAAVKGTEYAGMGFKEMMDSGATLNELLDLMGVYAQDSGLSMVDMFSSIEAGKAAMALSGENSAKFASNLEAMGTSADVVGDAYEKMDRTLQSSVGKIGTAMKNLGIQIYESNSGIIADVANQFADMATGLNTAFKEEGFDGLASALGGAISQVVWMIADYSPQFIDAGVNMISSFLEGIRSNSGELAEGALSIVSSLAQGVVRLLPEFASTAAGLIEFLAIGLSDSLPELVPVAVETIASLVEDLSASADQIIGAGIDILVALGEGIIKAVPTLIEKVPQIIINICDVINKNASRMLGAALELIIQLGIGLIKAIPTLIVNIPKIIEAIVKAFFAFQWVSLGKNLITAIAKGIKGMGSSMTKAAADISAAFTTKIKELPAKLLQIGKDIVQGMINGIKGSLSAVGEAAKELGANVLSNVKDFLGIKSPSRVMRDEVGAMLPLGMAKGIEQTTSKAVIAAKKMGKATFEASKEWIDEKKYYNELSLEEELEAWNAIQRQYKYGSDERKKANREVYRVQGEIEKQSFENSKKWIDSKKFYNDLSLADELKAWKRVQDRYLEGTEERIEADQKIYEVKSQISSELERLENNYTDALKNRTSEIFNSFGLFDSVKEENEVSGKELMDNLESQISAMETFYGNLEELSSRGVSADLVESIREMGVDASGELEALLSLSSTQLEEYSNLFGEKQKLANELATEELTGLREETDTQISELLEGVEDEFDRAPDLGLDMAKGLADGILGGMSDVIDAAIKVAQAAIKAAKEELDINSPSRVMRDQVGKMIPQGIAVGIDAEMPTVEQKMAKAYQTMRESFEDGARSLYTGAAVRNSISNASIVNNTENRGGDFILKIEKMVNDGKGSVSGLLQEAEFYRRQKVSATGGA